MHGRDKVVLTVGLLTAALTVLAGATPSFAAEPFESIFLAQADTAVVVEDPMAPPEPRVEPQFDEGKPWEVYLRYAITTDYVARGINYTDYPNEKRDRPNHEVTAGFEIDCFERRMGRVGVRVFAYFFSGMKAADPSRADHLGEIDYTAYWTNKFEEIDTKVDFGWTYRSWPRVSGDADDTNEFFVKLQYNDGAIYGEPTGVFNPFVFYAVDLDLADGGGWLELGVEHELALAEYTDAMVLRYMKITPSVSLGVDNRYLHAFSAHGAIVSPRERERGQEANRLANILYGLEMEYDLSSAFEAPPELGNLSLGMFIRYSDALREDILNDELYGGVQLTYRW